ncbi:tetratricopeptide repeat protein [bacterium]|nr:tetratricopeptide repeat protein [bacterium]
MDAQFYFDRGNEKYRIKDFLGAIDDFSKAIELNSSISPRTITENGPDNSTIYTNVFDICEGDVNSYYNRACAYYDSGQFAEALHDYTKVLEYTPDDAEAHFKRGVTNYCLFNEKEMEADLATAYRLNPKYSREYFLSLFHA